MKEVFLYFFCTILIQNNCFGQEQIWQFVKETNGVKVFYGETLQSPIKLGKIITTFDNSIYTIISVLTDVNKYPSWVYGVSESRIVERISSSEMNYYNKIDFPWPLSDRDILVNTKIIK